MFLSVIVVVLWKQIAEWFRICVLQQYAIEKTYVNRQDTQNVLFHTFFRFYFIYLIDKFIRWFLVSLGNEQQFTRLTPWNTAFEWLNYSWSNNISPSITLAFSQFSTSLSPAPWWQRTTDEAGGTFVCACVCVLNEKRSHAIFSLKATRVRYLNRASASFDSTYIACW